MPTSEPDAVDRRDARRLSPRCWMRPLLPMLVAVLSSPLPVFANVQSRFAGGGGGDWSQNTVPVGPPSGTCTNMGALGRTSDSFDFSFDVPATETIVGVVVRVTAAQANDEQVSLQLLASGGTVGSPVVETFGGTGGGNCSNTVLDGYGDNDDLSYWGSPALTPQIVNASDFGVRFVKESRGQVKVDSVCIDVYFRDGSGATSCGSTTGTGTLRIEKNATGGDGSFPFSVDTSPATDFVITTTLGTGSFEIPNLPPGVYAVSEVIPAGWDLTGASCDDDTSTDIGPQGDGTAAVEGINLNPGETVTCTFVDGSEAQSLGSITVIKEVVGPDPGSDWGFSGDLGAFDLPAAGGSQAFGGLAAGSYTVTEQVQDNYTPDVACTSGETGTDTVTVTLADGENVVCTFTNTADPASLVSVEKVVVGNPPANDWEYTSSAVDFTLPAVGGTAGPFALVPGVEAALSEIEQPGYTVAAECVDTDTNGSVASGSNSVSFTPDPGQQIGCTFTNTEVPTSITVEKSVDGGQPVNDWTFEWDGGDFVLDANGGNIILDTNPGTYTITETGGNPGYDVSVTCNGGETGTNSVTVEVSPGEEASCNFVNTFRPAPAASMPIPTLSSLALAATAAALGLVGGLARGRSRPGPRR
jgi:hypothetical protein